MYQEFYSGNLYAGYALAAFLIFFIVFVGVLVIHFLLPTRLRGDLDSASHLPLEKDVYEP